jgi:hypothetical protein
MPNPNSDQRDPRDSRARHDLDRGYIRENEEFGGRLGDAPIPSRYPYDSFNRERPRGSFFGRGPKGYRRSDERIREEVCDRLTTHPDIDASDLEVHVANGIVTLTGTVESRHEKRIAEYIADDAVGVDDVDNRLKVRHGFWATLFGERAMERELPREPSRDIGNPSAEAGRANAARSAADRDASAR